MNEPYVSDPEKYTIINKITQLLHGLPIGQSRHILQEADRVICDCHVVDCTNHRFREKLEILQAP